MPLFRVSGDKVEPIAPHEWGPDFLEKNLEDLIWDFTDELLGEGLLTIARQRKVAPSLEPDIICLDRDFNVVVFELKKTIDRKQLAQALEYGGWARSTTLEQLSSLYVNGEEQFWKDLNDFSGQTVPRPLSGTPRIVLVSPRFKPATKAAIDLMAEAGLGISVVTVGLYQPPEGDLLVDVGIEGIQGAGKAGITIDGETPAGTNQAGLSEEVKGVKIPDLLSVGLLSKGEVLEWERPKVGEKYHATVQADGGIELQDGRIASSPSRAACMAAEIKSYDGWHAWTKVSTGQTLHELREAYVADGSVESSDEKQWERP